MSIFYAFIRPQALTGIKKDGQLKHPEENLFDRLG